MATAANEPYEAVKDGLSNAIRKQRSDCVPGEVAREILEYDSPGHMHLVGLDWQAERVVFYHCDREEVIFVTLHSNGLANGGAVMGSFEWGFDTWIEKMDSYWGWLHPRYRSIVENPDADLNHSSPHIN